ncbi:hypothetical protein GCM10011609_32150 [Lentzea pudingi]|uniref:Uncharacterized protein n=1 Tax=Lentzea pudingi TaxID=1789439 RepID=A0ABQ2HUV9_9PSEU|nr:hypothetical protein [Lentzea pudingi]GGM92319.1 hypothetical protein GCM10011609_32150 [Lentzea pudingi]
MTTTLPPERDLPPGRHLRIRAELERTVVRRRRGMRFATTATALAAVVTAVMLVRPDQPISGYWSSRPTISGLDAQRVKDVEEGCWKAARTPDRPVLHRYHQDAAGTFALLYTPTDALTCDLSTPGSYYSNQYLPSRKGFDTRWLNGHFSVDFQHQMSGDRAGRPGSQTVAGRVDSQVKRMTWTYFGRTVEAEIKDGTFVARILQPADWDHPRERDGSESLKAYDAEGRSLGDTRSDLSACYVDREGNIISGSWDPQQVPDYCKPGEPWR